MDNTEYNNINKLPDHFFAIMRCASINNRHKTIFYTEQKDNK